MDTQSAQPGLMQLFSNLGLATDSSLVNLEGQTPDGKGFAGLLSGYLPSQPPSKISHQSQNTDLNLLAQDIASASSINLLESTALTDESLPLLGQVLPPEAVNSLPINILTSDGITTTAEEASEDTNALNELSEATRAGDLHKTLFSPLAAAMPEGEAIAVLEEQGFYAQSLVSSVISSNSLTQAKVNNTPNTATESAKTVHLIPQKISGFQDSIIGETKTDSALILSASELEEVEGESADRFLGSELGPKFIKTKSIATTEVFAASTNTGIAQASLTDNTVSLALALNEDPTTESLDELIDAEVLEQGELEAELLSTERKQDDQALTLSKGQQAWGDAITERITMNATQDIKQVTIHLDPPELGSLELKMQVDDDRQTQVQVHVQNPQVREALESSAHRLRDMLAAEGLELSEFDVQADTDHSEQSPQNSDEQKQEHNSDTEKKLTEEISLEMPKSKNNNLLDTFV